MLITRVLPREEWATVLKDVPLGQALAALTLAEMPDVIAFVVEDDEQRLVACWSLIRMWHAEGVWIDPAHRTKIAAGRHLLETMHEEAGKLNAPVILSAADDTDFLTQRLLEHLGAKEMDLTMYRWPVLEGVEV